MLTKIEDLYRSAVDFQGARNGCKSREIDLRHFGMCASELWHESGLHEMSWYEWWTTGCKIDNDTLPTEGKPTNPTEAIPVLRSERLVCLKEAAKSLLTLRHRSLVQAHHLRCRLRDWWARVWALQFWLWAARDGSSSPYFFELRGKKWKIIEYCKVRRQYF